jgi:hypothetical protein
MSAPLFTNLPDPAVRLRRTHEALAVMKERHKALPAELLKDVNHFIPPAVFARAARALAAFPVTSPTVGFNCASVILKVVLSGASIFAPGWR